jgi:hypothetical protein
MKAKGLEVEEGANETLGLNSNLVQQDDEETIQLPDEWVYDLQNRDNQKLAGGEGRGNWFSIVTHEQTYLRVSQLLREKMRTLGRWRRLQILNHL